MSWCHQGTSHYLYQCCPSTMTPYGIIRSQWVKHSETSTFHQKKMNITTRAKDMAINISTRGNAICSVYFHQRSWQHYHESLSFCCLDQFMFLHIDFDQNFSEVCSWECNWQYVNIWLGNALLPNDSMPWSKSDLTTCSVENSHRSVDPRPSTLEEDRELLVDFSLISCLWFKIQGMRTYKFFATEFSNTDHMVSPDHNELTGSWPHGLEMLFYKLYIAGSSQVCCIFNIMPLSQPGLMYS